MGYGRSVSRFVERKRSVADEDIGPLIATEMTRCIQCTRCVRFVGEVAGTYELGGMSAARTCEIGTYIGKTIESEIGGNIIDVCPVGALTNKPFRFQARAWELDCAREHRLSRRAGFEPSGCTRAAAKCCAHVPRDNEAINECWLSDRDRYSASGPVRGRSRDAAAAEEERRVDRRWLGRRRCPPSPKSSAPCAATISARSCIRPTHERRRPACWPHLARGAGQRSNIDHRLRQPRFLPMPRRVAGRSRRRSPTSRRPAPILLLGSNLRHELPLLNQRIGARPTNRIDFNDREGRLPVSPVDGSSRRRSRWAAKRIVRTRRRLLAEALTDDAAARLRKR